MSWLLQAGWVVVLTIAFMIFYSLVYSVILGIRDNYFRYYQKAELQWTGPGRRSVLGRVRLAWLFVCSLGSALIVLQLAKCQ